jgi:hypothetical protein
MCILRHKQVLSNDHNPIYGDLWVLWQCYVGERKRHYMENYKQSFKGVNWSLVLSIIVGGESVTFFLHKSSFFFFPFIPFTENAYLNACTYHPHSPQLSNKYNHVRSYILNFGSCIGKGNRRVQEKSMTLQRF